MKETDGAKEVIIGCRRTIAGASDVVPSPANPQPDVPAHRHFSSENLPSAGTAPMLAEVEGEHCAAPLPLAGYSHPLAPIVPPCPEKDR